MSTEYDFSGLLKSLSLADVPTHLVELAETPSGKSAAFSGFLHAQGTDPIPVEEYAKRLAQKSLLKPHEYLGDNFALDELQILAYKAVLMGKG